MLHRAIAGILKTILFGDYSVDHILYNLCRILLELDHSISQLSVKLAATAIRTFHPVYHVELSLATDLLLTTEHLIPVFQNTLAFGTDTDFITLYIKTCSSSLYSSVYSVTLTMV